MVSQKGASCLSGLAPELGGTAFKYAAPDGWEVVCCHCLRWRPFGAVFHPAGGLKSGPRDLEGPRRNVGNFLESATKKTTVCSPVHARQHTPAAHARTSANMVSANMVVILPRNPRTTRSLLSGLSQHHNLPTNNNDDGNNDNNNDNNNNNDTTKMTTNRY